MRLADTMFPGLLQFKGQSIVKEMFNGSLNESGRRKRSTLDYDCLTKILLIGDSGVGKSCMLIRFTEEEFNPDHMITIGVDFKIKSINLNGYTVKIQAWDTAGQERYRSITQAYYRSADGILLVFDTTSRSSFENVSIWMDQIRTFASSEVSVVLVGNKADVLQKVVTESEAMQLAKEFGIEYVQTSAKTGQNVNAAFLHCVHQILQLQEQNTGEPKGIAALPRDAVGMVPHRLGLAQSMEGGLENHSEVDRIRHKIKLRRDRQIQGRMQEEEDDCCPF